MHTIHQQKQNKNHIQAIHQEKQQAIIPKAFVYYHFINLRKRGVHANMTIQFSHHAMEKAHRRGVNMSHIYQTLKTPDQLYKDVEHGTIIAVKKTNDKSIILPIERGRK
jgi:hypothetical protein